MEILYNYDYVLPNLCDINIPIYLFIDQESCYKSISNWYLIDSAHYNKDSWLNTISKSFTCKVNIHQTPIIIGGDLKRKVRIKEKSEKVSNTSTIV